MAYSFVIGDILVRPDEFQSKISSGEIGRFRTALSARSKAAQASPQRPRRAKPAELDFSTGTVTDEGVLAAQKSSAPGFQAVGIGRPLSIEIAGIYTGDAPNTALGSRDLLVASAVKSIATYEAAPRAINQLIHKIKDLTYYPPTALTEGCPIVYYTPSLADETLLCSFELVTETFNKQTLQLISRLMAAAGGLPVFAPASLYLTAGSEVIKIVGDLGKLVLQKPPFLRDDLNLYFETPGIDPSVAHAAVIYNQKDEADLVNLKVQKVGKQSRVRLALVDPQSGAEYAGTAPYMVALIDGRVRPDLANFTPKLASAALLERFYKASGDTAGKLDEIFTAAMELYNDFTFRQKAEKLKAQIGELDTQSETYRGEKARLEKLLAACRGNIRSEALKRV